MDKSYVLHHITTIMSAKDEPINLPNRVIFLSGLTFADARFIFAEFLVVTVAVAVCPFGAYFETSCLIFAVLSEGVEADNSEKCDLFLMTSATRILDLNEDLIDLKLPKHGLLHVLIFLPER
jgi:hypothetical protein